MSRWLRRHSFQVWLGVAVLIGGAVAVLDLGDESGSTEIVARVDSRPITRADFNAYASVFAVVDGERVLSDNYVLLALVNQAVVLNDAAQRGFDVPDSELDRLMVAANELPVRSPELDSEAGRSAYRARLKTKLLFDMVKEVVTGDLQPSDADLRGYFSTHRVDYPTLSFEDVRFEIATLVRADMVTTRWRAWVAQLRACASIVVQDRGFSLPPETFEGRCRGEEPV